MLSELGKIYLCVSHCQNILLLLSTREYNSYFDNEHLSFYKSFCKSIVKFNIFAKVINCSQFIDKLRISKLAICNYFDNR